MEAILAQYLMEIGYRFQKCGQWSEGWSCYDCIRKYKPANTSTCSE